jgi:uncharacterized SAM-binding protein YcdF (DUF218 family)
MFFAVSKLLWAFAAPSQDLLLIALVGFALSLAGFQRAGRAALGLGLGALAFVAVAPVGSLVLARLEAQFPPLSPTGPIAGIVVLGGALNAADYDRLPGSGFNPAVGRIVAAARLAKQFPTARLLFSGGPTPADPRIRSEAEAARDLFVALGIDRARVELETKSRDTYENAIYAKPIANPRPGEAWLLVTSAFHMPRAVGCFRQAGFAIEPYPVDYRWTGKREGEIGLVSGLENLDLAAHEFTGLTAYWLAGKTDAWLPRARP